MVAHVVVVVYYDGCSCRYRDTESVGVDKLWPGHVLIKGRKKNGEGVKG